MQVDQATAAFGLSEVVDENMSTAARMHAVENGKELSEFTMIAFGGAAPLHAARLCEKLAVADLLIPPGAGVGSAIGFLRAPFGFESVRSAYMRLSSFDAVKAKQIIDELIEEASSFVRTGAGSAEPTLECMAFMRYVGQGWELPVNVPVEQLGGADGQALKAGYDREYEAFFGRTIDGLDIEVVSWSLRASSAVATPQQRSLTEKSGPARISGKRRLFDARLEGFQTAAVVDREHMRAGDWVAGPAVITERETTTIVTASREAIMQADGCLLLRAVKA